MFFRKASAEAIKTDKTPPTKAEKHEESVEEALARLSAEAKYQTPASKTQVKSKTLNETISGLFQRQNLDEATTKNPKEEILLESVRDEQTIASGSPYYAEAENDKARKLYPERGGDKYKSSWWDVMMKGEGREGIDKIKCERNVYKCLTKSPLVKLLLGALKSSGCEVDFRRHISCEVCDTSVTGGYDPFVNQVIVCQNTARSLGMVQGVLTHEMIHMFDYCRHKLDLNNVKHLACTEIRAANLAHCSFLSAMTQGTASFVNIKEAHRVCVKERAFQSVKSVREISDEDAVKAVESVFDKCYNDLEPVGRRIRRHSNHIEKAYIDRLNLGYD